MSPAVAFVEANAAEGRIPVQIVAPKAHHAALRKRWPLATILPSDECVVRVLDEIGVEWTANLPEVW